MAHTRTATRSATITATETRVRAVLRQVNVDLYAAVSAGLLSTTQTRDWYDDLTYMLTKDALIHFELRVHHGGRIIDAWRYEVSNDGSLTLTDKGGGINFYALPRTATITLTVRRRPQLPAVVSAEIDRRGWTVKVQNLNGVMTRERAYSKDGYGVVRHRFQMS